MFVYRVLVLALVLATARGLPPVIVPCEDATSSSLCSEAGFEAYPCAWCPTTAVCREFPGCDVLDGEQPSAWAEHACFNDTAAVLFDKQDVCDGTTNKIIRQNSIIVLAIFGSVVGSLGLVFGSVALYVRWRRCRTVNADDYGEL